MKLLLFFTAILAARASVPLSTDDFDEKTQGKAFVKFYVSWCKVRYIALSSPSSLTNSFFSTAKSLPLFGTR